MLLLVSLLNIRAWSKDYPIKKPSTHRNNSQITLQFAKYISPFEQRWLIFEIPLLIDHLNWFHMAQFFKSQIFHVKYNFRTIIEVLQKSRDDHDLDYLFIYIDPSL